MSATVQRRCDTLGVPPGGKSVEIESGSATRLRGAKRVLRLLFLTVGMVVSLVIVSAVTLLNWQLSVVVVLAFSLIVLGLWHRARMRTANRLLTVLTIVGASVTGLFVIVWLVGTVYEWRSVRPLRELQQHRATERQVVVQLGLPSSTVTGNDDPRKLSMSQPAPRCIRPLRKSELKVLVYSGVPKSLFPRRTFVYIGANGRVTEIVTEGT